MPHIDKPSAEFKLVMLGETFTGKTSLVLRFAEGYYKESARNPTVGAFFVTKRLTVQGMTAKIQIWDTAGQEQFKKLAPMYYKSAAAAIICYDVTSPKSFETLEYWMNELKENFPDGGIVIGMCATKCDLEDNPDTSQAEALAAQHGAIFLKTSSKTNSNVQLLFQKVTEKVLECQLENEGLLNVKIGTATPLASPTKTPTPTASKTRGFDTSAYGEEKKTDLDVSNDLVEKKDLPDEDKQIEQSQCESAKMMCGGVVGVTEDGLEPMCCIQ